jgi:uncharacterized membrane protein
MRWLLLALIVLIVVVIVGTAGLLFSRTASPSPSHPVAPTAAGSTTNANQPTDDPPKSNDPPAENRGGVTPHPEPPKSSAKSELKPLNKEKTLYLETLETGEKRVLFAADVCLREGVLEVLVCKKQTKEHEAILRTDLDARFLHAALLATGAKNGKPVQWMNPKTEEPDYKPASGQTIRVNVHYVWNGKTYTHLAQDWILDKSTKKPMAHDWVFAGSRFVKNPERPEEPDYYTANNGEVISISNFVDSMLDLPVQVSKDEHDLHFEALTDKIPKVGTPVWVILEPVVAKK